MEELNAQEIEFLLEAVDSHECSGNAGRLQGHLMGALLGNFLPEEGQAELEKYQVDLDLEVEQKQADIKEFGILIKSKLVMMKHSTIVSNQLSK